jgi:large subunit ribosomal protein L3
MTQIWDSKGAILRVTAIEAGPCVVVQKKTIENDGYTALQLGFEECKEKRLTLAVLGHFKKAKITPRKVLREFRVSKEVLEKYDVGQEIKVDIFSPGDFVDITGRSKGRGFQGVMKRHGFAGADSSHGTHEYFRHGGSIGCSTTPGRVIKGTKMPGQMGQNQVTIQNLKIIRVLPEKNLLLVKGAIPGPNKGYVIVKKALSQYPA